MWNSHYYNTNLRQHSLDLCNALYLREFFVSEVYISVDRKRRVMDSAFMAIVNMWYTFFSSFFERLGYS